MNSTFLIYGLSLCVFILSSSASGIVCFLFASIFKCFLVDLYPLGSGVVDCLGETRVYICTVTGPTLVWNYASNDIGFSTSVKDSRSFGQFIDVELVSISDDEIQSVAIVKVNHDINGTTLYCRNNIAVSSSIKKNITFNVQGNSSRCIIWLCVEQHIIAIKCLLYLKSPNHAIRKFYNHFRGFLGLQTPKHPS